jgi:predicted PurR-regulated permease PerM
MWDFVVIIVILPVLFFNTEIVDTRCMIFPSLISEEDMELVDENPAGFQEFVSIQSGVCFSLAATVSIGMTLVGASLPLAAAASLLLIGRSTRLFLLASNIDIRVPWFGHLADQTK